MRPAKSQPGGPADIAASARSANASRGPGTAVIRRKIASSDAPSLTARRGAFNALRKKNKSLSQGEEGRLLFALDSPKIEESRPALFTGLVPRPCSLLWCAASSPFGAAAAGKIDRRAKKGPRMFFRPAVSTRTPGFAGAASLDAPTNDNESLKPVNRVRRPAGLHLRPGAWAAPAVLSLGSRVVLAGPVREGPLVEPRVFCAELSTPLGAFIGLWCNDTAPGGGGGRLDISTLVREMVRMCQATSKQRGVDCASLSGSFPLLLTDNHEAQACLHGDPARSRAEPGFLQCAASLLSKYVDKGGASGRVPSQVALLSKAEVVGISVGLAVGVGLLVGWAIFSAKRSRATRNRSSRDVGPRDHTFDDVNELDDLPPPYPGLADDHRLSSTYPDGATLEVAHAPSSRGETPPPLYVGRR